MNYETTEDYRQRLILIVEDEPMIALALEELLIDVGFGIAGVAGRLDSALAIIESGICEGAVLDANLAGVSAGPAALALKARCIPFVVVSGYSPHQQSDDFDGAPRLQKPCKPDHLIQTLQSAIRAGIREGAR